jgi:Flp pilus assembly protein TadB
MEQRAGFAGMVFAALSGFLVVPAWAWAVALVLVFTSAAWLAVEFKAARRKG